MWNFREHTIQMPANSSHSDLFLSSQEDHILNLNVKIESPIKYRWYNLGESLYSSQS